MKVSILVPTYGRTALLKESIQSFIRQDYEYEMEMIIINDNPRQEISIETEYNCSTKSISIYNTESKIETLGEKRNSLLECATGELSCFWDDDDIYLDSFVSDMVSLYKRRKEGRNSIKAFRASHCWQIQNIVGRRSSYIGNSYRISDNIEIVIRDSGCMWNLIMETNVINKIGGFEKMDRLQDVNFFRKLVGAKCVYGECNTPKIPSCIHRINANQYTKATDFKDWHSPSDNLSSSDFHKKAYDKLIDSGAEPEGEVVIKPMWDLDYNKIAKNAWFDDHPDRKVPRIGEAPDMI